MLCQTCLTLSFKYGNRRCIRCPGTSTIVTAILCDSCSNKDGVCGICLKKVESITPNTNKGGCRCGKK